MVWSSLPSPYFARTDALHRRQRSTFLAMSVHIPFCVYLTYLSHVNSDSLHQAFQDPIQGLYTSNTSLPLGQPDSDCIPPVPIPTIRGHALATPSPVNSNPTTLPRRTCFWTIHNSRTTSSLLRHLRSRHTPDSTHMSPITFCCLGPYL